MSLMSKKCTPCEGSGQPLDRKQADKLRQETPQWQLSGDNKMISRLFVTKNFLAAVDFINKVAQVAELENHHPDIHLSGYRQLRIDLSTHAIGGLSENDFILAAKIDKLPVELKSNVKN